MRKAIILVLLMLCAVSVRAGTYTITTNASTDTQLQAWCFARNAAMGGTLFAQPGSASGITVANVKVCMQFIIQNDANNLSNQSFQGGFVPPTFTQWN